MSTVPLYCKDCVQLFDAKSYLEDYCPMCAPKHLPPPPQNPQLIRPIEKKDEISLPPPQVPAPPVNQSGIPSFKNHSIQDRILNSHTPKPEQKRFPPSNHPVPIAKSSPPSPPPLKPDNDLSDGVGKVVLIGTGAYLGYRVIKGIVDWFLGPDKKPAKSTAKNSSGSKKRKP